MSSNRETQNDTFHYCNCVPARPFNLEGVRTCVRGLAVAFCPDKCETKCAGSSNSNSNNECGGESFFISFFLSSSLRHRFWLCLPQLWSSRWIASSARSICRLVSNFYVYPYNQNMLPCWYITVKVICTCQEIYSCYMLPFWSFCMDLIKALLKTSLFSTLFALIDLHCVESEKIKHLSSILRNKTCITPLVSNQSFQLI